MKREDIILKISNNITDTKSRIEAWRKVKRLTKKDGSDFAIKSKNIDGAKFNSYTYVENYEHPYLTICYICNGFSKEESLPMFEYIDDMQKNNDVRLENKDQIIEKHGISRGTYIYSIDECFQAIERYILKLENNLKEYIKQLDNADFYINKADKIINDIKSLINEDGLKNEPYKNTLCYETEDYIRSSIY